MTDVAGDPTEGPSLSGGEVLLDASDETSMWSAVRDGSERVALPLVWGVLCLVFTVIPKTASTFPTSGNFETIFGSQSVILILTLALLVPLVAGDYDLSVAFNLTLSSVLLAVLNVQDHWAIGAAVGVVLAVGVGVGMVNAFFTLVFAIDPFIVTLGTGTVLGGLALWISGSNTISGVSTGLVNVVAVDTFVGIPLCFYYALGLCCALWYFLDYTPSGQRLLIVGRSRTVARLSGIGVPRMRLGAFVASGAISALAGVAYVGTAGGADPVSGSQLLLPAFAAAFLGSTTIRPGSFNPWGAAIAVYFLITGITGLQLLGLQGYVQDLFYGSALVLAVALSQVMRRDRRSVR